MTLRSIFEELFYIITKPYLITMKKQLPLIVSILVLLLLFGCKNEIEVIEEKDEAGNVIVSYERRIADFAKHGYYKAFHSDGEIFEESTYVDNHMEGLRTLYHKNGKKQAEEFYKKGKLEGDFKGYYASGVIQREGVYSNHAMKGEWKFYYGSGKLKEVVTFDNNEEQGPFKEYYENGNLKAEGFYQDGDNEAGPLKLYDEMGKLKERLNCKIVFFADIMASQCESEWKAEEDEKAAEPKIES